MFKPSSLSENFVLPVTAHVPDEKGKSQKVSFELICKRLAHDEVRELWKAVTSQPPKNDQDGEQSEERERITDEDVIDQVVVGFGKGLLDENDKPMEYTPENHAAVFSVHPITPRAVACFFDHYMKAGIKN